MKKKAVGAAGKVVVPVHVDKAGNVVFVQVD